jgi:hypothetical protein
VLCRLSGERGTAPMGPGHVGSIPLLATRLEQATAAEAIIRWAGYPESMLYGPAKAQRVADSPNPATKPGPYRPEPRTLARSR